MSEELAVAEPLNPIRAMEAAWPEKDREALAKFVGVEPDNEAFIPFLAIAADLGLNPLTGEIWLIETHPRVKNAQGRWESTTRYQPAVGRDGLLKLARQEPTYRGFTSGVHCAGDDFAIDYTRQACHHVQTWDGENRGKILGAWCRVALEGRAPLFYYAPLREHGQYDTDNQKWRGAWDYVSAMILKAAVSYAHRLALGVSGFVPVDELNDKGHSLTETAGLPSDMPALDVADDLREAAPDLPDDLRQELEAALREANALSPFSWGPAKIRMRLGGKDADAARSVLDEIREDTARSTLARSAVPEPAEPSAEGTDAEND